MRSQKHTDSKNKYNRKTLHIQSTLSRGNSLILKTKAKCKKEYVPFYVASLLHFSPLLQRQTHCLIWSISLGSKIKLFQKYLTYLQRYLTSLAEFKENNHDTRSQDRFALIVPHTSSELGRLVSDSMLL